MHVGLVLVLHSRNSGSEHRDTRASSAKTPHFARDEVTARIACVRWVGGREDDDVLSPVLVVRHGSDPGKLAECLDSLGTLRLEQLAERP
jgi:hypothetical protein